MKKYLNIVKKFFLGSVLSIGVFSIFLSNISTAQAQSSSTDRYDDILSKSTEKIGKHLEKADKTTLEWGAKSARDFIIKKIIDIVIPIMIVVGVILAIIWFYRLLFSDNADTTRTWMMYIVYGVIGIIIMMSARYLTDVVTQGILFGWGSDFVFEPGKMVSELYDKVAYPFLKVLFYLIIWFLFVSLVSKLLKYLFSSDDDMKKHAGTIMSRNVIAILIIIGSKQIIEAVYGKQDTVIKGTSLTNTLGDIGNGVLATKEIPIVYTIINWVMGLSSLVILIIIIYQSYLLLVEPDNEDQFKKIKKSLLYIFIGLLVIGSGYLITNFLIID